MTVRITDTTLRDGSHALSHTYDVEQVREIVRLLEGANVRVIEVAHGDGLSGSSFNYGFSSTPELELIAAAVDVAQVAHIACLVLPGIGTGDDLRAAADLGVRVVRIATHCTEADIAIQHFQLVRKLGLEAVGFLMLGHMASPERMAREARIMVDAGAECVYVVDSAGALVPSEAAARVAAVAAELRSEADVGFHGHQNLTLAVANSVAAYEAGARQIDGTLAGLGAGAGNAPTEVLAAVFDRLGVATGLDVAHALNAASRVPELTGVDGCAPDRAAITLGYAGVYSSFLLHAEAAAKRYGVAAHEILSEVGRNRYVGGQEDLVIDVAIGLARRRQSGAAA